MKKAKNRGCAWCVYRTESGSCSLSNHGNTKWSLKTLREPLYDDRLGSFYIGENCGDFIPEGETVGEVVVFS